MAAPAKRGPGRYPQDRAVAPHGASPAAARIAVTALSWSRPEFQHQNAIRREQARGHERQFRDTRQARPARHRARAADRSRALRAASRQSPRARRRADWKRQHRPAPEALPRNRRPRTTHGRTRPSAAALSRAQPSAVTLISVPIPKAFGSSESSASSSAPEPVPRSTMRSARELRCSPSSAASAASTTVSVSGRGSRVSALSLKRQPPKFLAAENARDRLMREPARRQRGDGVCLLGASTRRGLRHQRSVVEPERVADDDARIELGRIDALLTELARQTPARASTESPANVSGR